ncbi:aldehyde dehydrogenase family protein [Shouchella clausii]|uniref:3-sulfolactaldehyde dehydrogenase n=1 Tax=Shouchella clausii TaxID=79880 RepID=A0A268NZK6_SHOCL|nr:aldehyde dehydrogenase family protein [Shouchella clausii]PAE88932.1 aldehyde dehydrogenase family protein [Shouchella clausii]
MVQTYLNYIDGEWKPSISGNVFYGRNPANYEEILGAYQASTAEDARLAIKSAAAAFPNWKNKSAIERADVLYQLMPLLAAEKEKLAAIITKEVGKTMAAARKEVDASIQALKHFSGAANRLAGETVPAGNPETFAYTIKEPLGPVGVITPFNFPLGIGIYKIAPALIAGNTVVYKPHNDTVQIAARLVELFIEAGTPKGVLNLVTGDGDKVGQELGENRTLKAISFTGSSDVGLRLGRSVTNRGGKMQAEMGGKNATVILEDADLDKAVSGIVISGLLNNGQSCTGTSRVIVPKNIAKTVTSKLVEKATAIRVGDGFNENVENGPVANEAQLQKYLHYVDIAVKEGAKLECGGKRLFGEGKDKGYFVAPTVLSGVTSEMTIAQEEVFAPVVAIMEVDSFDEAIAVANQTNFGLSSAIYTTNLQKAHEFVRRVETGVTHINIPSNHYENQLPFGGKKNSSIGPREQGSTALDFWVDTKAVYLKP